MCRLSGPGVGDYLTWQRPADGIQRVLFSVLALGAVDQQFNALRSAQLFVDYRTAVNVFVQVVN
jgi:hypothetical protein